MKLRKLIFIFIFLSFIAIPISISNAVETTSEMIELAEKYILENQNSDGGFPILPDGESDVEVTAFVVQAMIVKGYGTGWSVINRAVDYLIDQQHGDGSWNENTAHTIFALQALDLSERDPDVRFKAMTWIEKAQNPDGSWGKTANSPSNLFYTSVVLAGLRHLATPRYTPISKASKWLADPHRVNYDGGWSIMRGSKSDVMVTAWVLNGISLIYDVDEQLAWLKQQQNDDNGFAKSKGKPSDAEITAYVLIALAAGEDPLNTAQIAIGYLRSVQQADGSFVSSTPIELKKPIANLQTTAFVHLAVHAKKIAESY